MDRVEDDLEDLLGPEPADARELQQAAKKQVIGLARITQPNPGPGRIPGGKCTPQRMRGILKNMSEMPNVARALRLNNLSRPALQLWLEKSARGLPGDEYDLVVNPNDPPEEWITERFHILYDQALQDAMDEVEGVAHTRAIGYEEALSYKGHVSYKVDPEMMIMLGIYDKDDPRIWLYKDGQPVIESIVKQDTDMIALLLKAHKPDIYGNKQKIDVTHRGGVLVVAAKASDGKELNAEEAQYKSEAIDVEFEEVSE